MLENAWLLIDLVSRLNTWKPTDFVITCGRSSWRMSSSKIAKAMATVSLSKSARWRLWPVTGKVPQKSHEDNYAVIFRFYGKMNNINFNFSCKLCLPEPLLRINIWNWWIYSRLWTWFFVSAIRFWKQWLYFALFILFLLYLFLFLHILPFYIFFNMTLSCYHTLHLSFWVYRWCWPSRVWTNICKIQGHTYARLKIQHSHSYSERVSLL